MAQKPVIPTSNTKCELLGCPGTVRPWCVCVSLGFLCSRQIEVKWGALGWSIKFKEVRGIPG